MKAQHARQLSMFDLIYVAGTVAFFALMAGYVRFCAALGDGREIEEREP